MTLSEHITQVRKELSAAQAKIDEAYWYFSRCARANPPCVAVPEAYADRKKLKGILANLLEEQAAEEERMIKVTYESIDGVCKTRKYKTLRGAQAFAHKWVGKHPDIGGWYAVSFDGIGKITVDGCSIHDLFPEPIPIT